MFEEVVRGLHPKAIDILELVLSGLTNQEIADRLQMGLRTVELIIEHMRKAWINATGHQE
jgi:DNA-binding CsgD family transcriptional regulator